MENQRASTTQRKEIYDYFIMELTEEKEEAIEIMELIKKGSDEEKMKLLDSVENRTKVVDFINDINIMVDRINNLCGKHGEDKAFHIMRNIHWCEYEHEFEMYHIHVDEGHEN